MFAGQFEREDAATYEVATLRVDGDKMSASVYVNEKGTDDILSHSIVECHKYFRFDFILAMLSRGWA